MSSGYIQLIFYKALNSIAMSAKTEDLLYWSSYDATYLMPIAVMLLNYNLLKKSEHPFLVNIRQMNPFWLQIFVLYSSGLAIVLPKTYLIGYLAYGSTHILLRTLKQRFNSQNKVKNEFD